MAFACSDTSEETGDATHDVAKKLEQAPYTVSGLDAPGTCGVGGVSRPRGEERWGRPWTPGLLS